MQEVNLFKNLQKDMDEMDEEKKIFADITSKMQQYFCVREDLFKLQDFLQTLKKFCDQIEQVRKVSVRSQKFLPASVPRRCVSVSKKCL